MNSLEDLLLKFLVKNSLELITDCQSNDIILRYTSVFDTDEVNLTQWIRED
jgi:hypothetical protein